MLADIAPTMQEDIMQPANGLAWLETGPDGRPIRFKSVLLLGAPGSGKGTQGNILKATPGFYHFSSGEAFRRLDPESRFGKLFLEHSTRGELVPDQLVLEVWLANIQAHVILGDFHPARHLLLLDGVPRTVQQAQMVERYIDVLAVVHLVCHDREAVMARLRARALKENRPDDTDEKVIRNRFEVYERQTRPILDYYPKDRIIDVDCVGVPARVASRILAALAPLLERLAGG
jgi:adenylate kinase